MTEQIVSDMPPSLAPDLLRRICREEELADVPDHGTSALDDLFVGVEQSRMRQALDLALSQVSKKHLFVTGLSGPRALDGIKTYMTRHLASAAKPIGARDWCYFYNFDNPLEPIAVSFNKGRGNAIRDRMNTLLDALRTHVPAALVRDDVVADRQRIMNDIQTWWDTRRSQIISDAKKDGMLVTFGAKQTTVRIISRKEKATVKNGKIVTPVMDMDERGELDPQERQACETMQQQWILHVNMAFVEHQRRSRETDEKIVYINRRVVGETVEEQFKSIPFTSERTSAYKEELKQFAIDNFPIFSQTYQQGQSQPPQQNMFIPWMVNVLVDNSTREIAPVVVDYDGTFPDLVGRIERVGGQNGLVYTDHTMISAGSIARANGGYLIVDAMNVLRSTGSYEVLKRVLNNGALAIEELMSFYGMGSTVPLQPMPIPVHMKVIMVGSRDIWSLLCYRDPEFLELFEKAEVAPYVEWTPRETSALAHWMRRYAAINQLLPPENGALQRLVEHAARITDNRNRLSTDFTQIEPIVNEASYLAKEENADSISRVHIRRALERKFYRSDLHYRYRQEMIRDKKIILPLRGEAIGQMTILAVTDLGDMQVGFPGRLTCQWSVGRPGFVSIHREAKLAGEILQKGELTVQGYLKSLFAKRYALALEISYTAEQVYGMVDGDSASMALSYCIISALADIPIRQGIAITGSLSQRGEPQLIGGVNEKIEGFFDCCAIDGLMGMQGVIIPRSNVNDLMLAERVVEAVENDAFHIWPIDTIDQGLRILMGKDAGIQLPDFTFTPGSVFDMVDKRLLSVIRHARDFFKDRDDDMI